MRQHLHLRGRGSELDPAEAFSRLSDFEGYKQHSDVILAVQVSRDEGGTTSEWEVEFQSGTLIWRERDELDEVEREIRFELLDGDPAAFEGSWRVSPESEGCVIDFEAVFDLGVASFEDVLDPLARRTMVDNVGRILTGLFPQLDLEEVAVD
jgi:ribosome-associated toxin RatA of RatAB toxin-antitoxin module